VTLKIRLQPFKTYTRSRTLPAHTAEPETVANTALELLERFDPQTPVRLIGVGVAGLVGDEDRHPKPGQLAV
jgi:nucleotidyltransferase/DNA polymerase involved in DNA repair